MIGQSVGELLEEKVTLDVEGIDRLYLNLVPAQTAGRRRSSSNIAVPRWPRPR
jgi:hypothetical protein